MNTLSGSAARLTDAWHWGFRSRSLVLTRQYFFSKPVERLRLFKDLSAVTACCDEGEKEDKHMNFVVSLSVFSLLAT